MVSFNAALKRVNRVLAVGTVESLKEQVASTDSFLLSTLTKASSSDGVVRFDGAHAANLTLLKHAIGTLAPTTDNGANAQLLLIREGSEGAFPVTFHALPTQVSRSNTLARPHSIHSFVKNNRALISKAGSDNESDDEVVLVALVLPSHTETWFAAGAAVARAAPAYLHKQKKSSGLPVDNAEEAVKTNADKLAVVYAHDLSESEKALIQRTADGIQLAVRLTDAPPNELHSDAFIAEALRVAKRTNSKAVVIQGEELKKRGFGGIYGVGKAATHLPALVALSHYPEGTSEETKGVTLVGKGIVYDTGGLSIKTGGFMVGMKRDMGGAAAVLSGFEAAVLAKNTTDKTPLHVILCIAENSVGPLATRPDDIHTLYSGKTVEINNTDAEGRLVLADGVAYAAKHLNPKVIVDMATLTGAQGITTGQRIGAIYTNDEDLERLAVKAGKASGDLVHPVPYAPEFYRAEFKSTVADMKNSVKNRTNAQVSCAGQFIGNHLGEYETTGRWLHVDMAYPVFTAEDERATGFGVAFIQSLLKEIDAAGW
uniref:Cytosol aminopeptidase domain-containing protein n=1 Tax=Globisporangium ultimum (strain ATCC 200006 / CBS 805.95 / DAOM BR144) TaxID=431595 RepID=K3WWD2_GLOUD